jgi:ketosteroid isomerase-like protein
MSLFHKLCVAVAVSCVVACAAPPAQPPAVDLAAEEQAIRDASAAWLQAAQARDAATIDGFLAADVTTIFGGQVHEGLAAVQASREEEWANQPDQTVMWTTSEVGVSACGDLAYERGHWTADPDGPGEAPEEDGEYLTVWKKIDGHWAVLYDTGTTLEAETGEVAEEE